MRVFFDNASTTQVDPKVLDAMLPFFTEEYGNASSIHSFGQEAQKAISQARDQIAKFLSCDPYEIIFTSGATESNNLAIMGVLNKWVKKNKTYHFITSKIEHPAVLQVYKRLEELGHEVSYLEVDENGVVNISELQNLIREKTLMISVMYVNNEVGAIQPVEKIGKLVKEINETQRQDKLPLYFHVDAVQAFNYLDCDINALNCHLLSFSGHKIHGPKGIGGLFVKQGVQMQNIFYGGHHERNLRPGTYNTPGIVGLGKAVELINEDQEKNIKKVKKLKEKILKSLTEISEIKINGQSDLQVPNIINVSFDNTEGESLLMLLDMDGIAISTGSACSSGSLEPSPVLTAMGVPVEWTHGSLRISLSKFNTEQEVNHFVTSLKTAIEKLRKMAPSV